MSSTLRFLLKRRHVPAVLAWLLVVLTGQVTEAACGDWLAGSEGGAWRHANAVAGSAQAVESAQSGSGRMAVGHESERPEKHCNGPSCGNRGPVKQPPVPTPPTAREHDDGVSAQRVGICFQRAPRFSSGDDEVAARQGYPEGIEHPPRT